MPDCAAPYFRHSQRSPPFLFLSIVPQTGAPHNPPDDGPAARAETIPVTPPGWSWEPPTERSADYGTQEQFPEPRCVRSDAAGRGSRDPHPLHVQGHGRGRIRADGDRCGIHQSGGQSEESEQPPRGMKGGELHGQQQKAQRTAGDGTLDFEECLDRTARYRTIKSRRCGILPCRAVSVQDSNCRGTCACFYRHRLSNAAIRIHVTNVSMEILTVRGSSHQPLIDTFRHAGVFVNASAVECDAKNTILIANAFQIRRRNGNHPHNFHLLSAQVYRRREPPTRRYIFTMNDLTTFTNPEFGQVRTVEIDGTPWLVGKDVAVALGYKNPGKAIIAHVDEEDKRLEMLPQETDSQNGNASPASKTALINESGLYSLILSSKMPKAKAFKRWVTSEVLPAIRKTGAYESFQAQQHIEQLEATNTRLNAAIQAVGTAKQQLADVISLRNDFIEHRDNYKARYMQAKTDYSRICDSLRQAEGLVAKAQADLDSRIDQLSIVAFGLPGFDEIMNAVIGTLPAKKEG
nr:MAG TPA: repressor domain protein [Caudoviricetes sp.]